VASSHAVQSVRAKVEHVFAELKLYKVMEGNKISSAKGMEKVLDCVLGIHNLNVLLKRDRMHKIPLRRDAIAGEHIFGPLEDEFSVNLGIPVNCPPLKDPKLGHIRSFLEFLPSAARAIRDAVAEGSGGSIFFPGVRSRGENLYNGAYVLQLQVQEESYQHFTVRFTVGASYSYQTHIGYFEMLRDTAVHRCVCDCFAG
jgi:hypothetical protein